MARPYSWQSILSSYLHPIIAKGSLYGFSVSLLISSLDDNAAVDLRLCLF